MQISGLLGLLQKVQQIAGDVDVVLQHADSEAQTVITDLGIHLDPSSGATGGRLTIEHGDNPPAALEQGQEGEPAASPAA